MKSLNKVIKENPKLSEENQGIVYLLEALLGRANQLKKEEHPIFNKRSNK